MTSRWQDLVRCDPLRTWLAYWEAGFDGRDFAALESLRRGRAPRDIVLALERLGVESCVIARATGVTERSVRSWKSGGAARSRHRARLAALAHVVRIIAPVGYPGEAVFWLLSANDALGGRSPASVLADGACTWVHQAAVEHEAWLRHPVPD